VIRLDASAACAEGGYEHYLELARARVATEGTFACLLAHRQPGVVDLVLRDLTFYDREASVSERRRRNVASFLAALGDAEAASICRWLRSPDPVMRVVVGRALVTIASAATIECLTEAARDTDPGVRAGAAGGLRLLVAQRKLDVAEAWRLAQGLAADGDPAVRTAAVPLLAMFDFDHAAPALAALAADPDGAVAQDAANRLQAVRAFKSLSPDLPY
ncbi:MAG TPA: HEAT repeat domain-containing protein, partial [Vicinamibacteria bacterium]|nr:HEAT repeat domain-containing protein [Vicinamibacteria bacterium]